MSDFDLKSLYESLLENGIVYLFTFIIDSIMDIIEAIFQLFGNWFFLTDGESIFFLVLLIMIVIMMLRARKFTKGSGSR